MKEDFSSLESIEDFSSLEPVTQPAKAWSKQERTARNLDTIMRGLKGEKLSPEERARLHADSIAQDEERKANKEADSKAAQKIEAAKIKNLPLVEAAERRGEQYAEEGRTPSALEAFLPRVAEARRRGGYGLLGMARAAGSDILSYPGASLTSSFNSPFGSIRMGFNAIRDYEYGSDKSLIRQVAESVGRTIKNTPAYMMQRDNMIADPVNVLGFGVGKALSVAAKMPKAASTLGKLMRAENLLASAGRGALTGGLVGGANGFMNPDATIGDVAAGAAYSMLPEAGGSVLGDIVASSIGAGLKNHAAHRVANAYTKAPGFNAAKHQKRLYDGGLRERFPVDQATLADLQTRVARGGGKGSYEDWDAAAEEARLSIARKYYDKAEAAVRSEIDRKLVTLDPYFGFGGVPGLAEQAAAKAFNVPTMADRYRTPIIEAREAARRAGKEVEVLDETSAAIEAIARERMKPHLTGLTAEEARTMSAGQIPEGRNYGHLAESQYPLDQALSRGLAEYPTEGGSALVAAARMQPEQFKVISKQIRDNVRSRQAAPEIGLNEELGDILRETLEGHLQERSPAWASIITPAVKERYGRASALKEFVLNQRSQGEAVRQNAGGLLGFPIGLKTYFQDYSNGDNFQRATEALRKAWKYQDVTVPTADMILPYLGRSAGAYAADRMQR